ncbi:dihydrofolate reductase family protein [Corallococcus sp. NCSPR001]|uniref:dihydrofolate reductase family protein n=1 Tax=Corallococcus sp. NCSPR001 TaxID=2813576 RepID=UPI00324287CB
MTRSRVRSVAAAACTSHRGPVPLHSSGLELRAETTPLLPLLLLALRHRTPFHHIVGVHGSAERSLAVALEEWGLIKEYRIVIHPIISGCGPTLFQGLSSVRHLEFLATQRFKSGVQALHFRRKAG